MRKIISLRLFQFIIVIIISISVGYIFGTNQISLSWENYTPIVSFTNKNPPAGQMLDMKVFYDILGRVNSDYYDKSKLNTQKVLQGAINGMLATLGDPYTAFFAPKENSDFKSQLSGEFSGIGAELSLSSDNKVVVVAPLDDSPAQKAGIKAGDVILKVDEDTTAGWTVAQAVDRIRGPRGTTVVLSVLHEKVKAPSDIKIERDRIVVKSVTGWVKSFLCEKSSCRESNQGKRVAYIRLSQFGDKTNDEWTKTVNSINSQIVGPNKAAGIVLDLRNNPGGYLNDAVFIASEFLESGVVVIQEDDAGLREALSVTRRGAFLSEPLIVLINKGSASASEIVSGALKDHSRAKLLGEKSFGKGTIQEAVDLDGGASVHISVAKWLTPNGTWVNKVGLKPDIEVALDASKSAKLEKGLDNQLNAAIQELLK